MRPRTAQHRAASESERGASAHRAAVRAQLNPTPAAKTVLVAEDDLWLRSIMVELLLEEDYRVIEAMDGAEALELAEREGPDVLVLDLRLPWRSGLEVLRRLRAGAKTATMPVIVVSGALDCEARARLARRAERADGVLEKPVDIGRLFDAVEQAAWSAPQPTGSGRAMRPSGT